MKREKNKIKEMKVELTMIDGKVLFDSNKVAEREAYQFEC
ncbi:hypothetical protein G3A_03945 [Bacillus sp. 17376]|nr:hypothetical protein G3A_03945 [Bacillus sp. 17376]